MNFEAEFQSDIANFIIKCIFDIEITFITSFMFVLDVSLADIFSIQHIRNIRVFRRQRILAHSRQCWIRHTLHCNRITLGHNC